MPSNLPEVQKENWSANEIVMPDNTNSWGRAINTLSKAVPLYSACGNVYTATYTNNVYNLTPLSFTDNTSNVTVDSYVDGMSVIFQCPTNNLANCSVNVNSLGAKIIKTIDNVNLPAGKLNSGVFVELKYDKTNDCFKFQQDFNKADRNFSNLTEEAEKHFLNKSQITNCLLEVPQRIKYDLTDGTLTIKAGSVVIVPYGVEDLTAQYPKGATFLHENYKVYDTQFEDGKFFVWAELVNDISISQAGTATNTNTVMLINLDKNELTYSNAEYALSGNDYSTANAYKYYETTTNTMYHRYASTEALYQVTNSFPIILFSRKQGVITSVNQVFNGIGYIGSTVWVDKGVKGLAPNGRNEDGTLRNIEFTTDRVSTLTPTISLSYGSLPVMLYSNNQVNYNGLYKYDEKNNLIYDGTTLVKGFVVGHVSLSNSVVTSFNPKLPFRAVDWNDLNESKPRIGQPQLSLDNVLPTNCVWLEGATVSRTTYSKLFAVYGTTYGDGDGSTTFVLPNFLNRAVWGSNDFGYIGAGLPNITGGNYRTAFGSAKVQNPTGVFGWTNGGGNGNCQGGYSTAFLNFDASRCSTIYGSSSTVQPPAIKVRVYARYQ